MQPKPTSTLPSTQQQRQQLLNTISKEILRLQGEINQNYDDRKLLKINNQCIEILKLRHKLISKAGELSLVRLNHLEEVFKHYCTHIYKTGKHMTFERLEYEKVHMTIERFFLFLKDFELTSAEIEGKKREVVDKNNIILIFKKMSSNARQLSFQQFIQSFEKLAVLYWDEKQNWSAKQKEAQQRMKNIKKENQKRMRKKMGLKSQQNVAEKSREEQQKANNNDQNQEEPVEQSAVEKQINKSEPVEVENNENDDLINELMNNAEIEDPNEEVRQIAEKAKRENMAAESVHKMKKVEFQTLLKLTNQEKIEYYYQLLNIDSVASYKNKLTILNTPNYIVHDRHSPAPMSGSKSLSESKLQAAQQHEEQRLLKLKAKMNEKKEKFKERALPKPSNEQALKEEENSRRRRQMKKERQKAVKEVQVEQSKKRQEKIKPPPKVQYKQGQVSWQMLQRISIDQLKLKQNLSKLYTLDEDDRYFLQQFGGRPKLTQRIQTRQRQSLSIVESTKMRAQQLQKKDRDTNYDKRQNTSFSRNKI